MMYMTTRRSEPKVRTTKEIDTGELLELLEKCRNRPMTEDERREHAASFAFGNLALTKEWHGKSAEELEHLRQECRRLAGCK